MRYFAPILDHRRLCNISGFTGNCYYCMVAALLNLTTAELGAHVGRMQRNSGGGFEEIILLLQRGGYPNACYRPAGLARLRMEAENMPVGTGLGFVYLRPSQRGHALVIAKDHAARAHLLDYQQNPPVRTRPNYTPNTGSFYIVYADRPDE